MHLNVLLEDKSIIIKELNKFNIQKYLTIKTFLLRGKNINKSDLVNI